MKDKEADIILKCYFDGACEPYNPGGNMGIGAIVLQNGNVIAEYSGFIQADTKNSNNVAEYLGFIKVIEKLEIFLQQNPDKKIKAYIYGDSQLVVNQMNGDWKIKEGRYAEYALIAKERLAALVKQKNIAVYIEWIRRERNSMADKLSKKGMIESGVVFKIQPEEIVIPKELVICGNIKPDNHIELDLVNLILLCIMERKWI